MTTDRSGPEPGTQKPEDAESRSFKNLALWLIIPLILLLIGGFFLNR